MPKPDFAAEAQMIHGLERSQRRAADAVKRTLRHVGRPDLADDLDRRLKDIETGVTAARATWHSISDAQRALLAHVVERTGNMRLVISGRGALTYDVEPPAVPLVRPARQATVRALAARGLLDWDGGAFRPEWAAVANERARFVLKHGRPEPGTHFEGYRPRAAPRRPYRQPREREGGGGELSFRAGGSQSAQGRGESIRTRER